MAGRMLVDLIEPSSKKVGEQISKNRSRNSRALNSQRAGLEQVLQEAQGLRKALLKVRLFIFMPCSVFLCFIDDGDMTLLQHSTLSHQTGRFIYFSIDIYGGTIAANNGLGIEQCRGRCDHVYKPTVGNGATTLCLRCISCGQSL
jgi:hypothetical protein